MRLKKLRLENIRSYQQAEIDFPEGSVLLAGDIGSGKSSILLAIDFALFGLQPGTLSGAALLRNGEKKGSVELHFALDSKNIVIKRSLKRTSTSITQDAGYLLLDGEKKDATAVELKQAILDLLQYPQELLTKSKSLIYRYTVYTPQEEMKQILLGDPDLRLDTLRKVFGIDKYKRIQANSRVLSARLRETRKEYAGRIADLEEKKRHVEDERAKEALQKKEHEAFLPLLHALQASVKQKKMEITAHEAKITQLHPRQHALQLADQELTSILAQRKRLTTQLDKLTAEEQQLAHDLAQAPVFDDTLLKDKENQLRAAETRSRELLKEREGLTVTVRHGQTLQHHIASLTTCPTCQQEVSAGHKQHIHAQEERKIQEILIRQKALEAEENQNAALLQALKREADQLLEAKHQARLFAMKQELLAEKHQRVQALQDEQALLKQRTGELNTQKQALYAAIEALHGIEEHYTTRKEELERLQEEEKDRLMEKAHHEAELSSLAERLRKLHEEITAKEHVREKLLALNQLQDWLDTHFSALMDLMEKQVMLSVHADFDALFQKWFGLLLENELLSVRLDETFTPLIEQNKHDIDYLHLSGGEKTAAALAYRVALNQVINNLMTTIKTKELLILDEPTDGFSTEQLDRVQLVLDELKIKQVILVSHESKIESYVDHVIRFEKQDHSSRISQLP